MKYRQLVLALVMGWLLPGSPAFGADETDTSRRTKELAAEAQALESELNAGAEALEGRSRRFEYSLRLIDIRGKLEQVRAEEELLKKVTAKTVPPAVKKDVAVARLTIQARTAKQRAERLQDEAKKKPADVSLALDLINAVHDERQLTEERNALRESKDGPDSKGFRVKRLQIQADSLRARLDAVRKRRDDEKDERGRALLAEKIQSLEARLEKAKAEREALEKEGKR